ncbi:MAG: mechanosensitive ion channel family protein [Acidobacteria bacterium]|nr:MAG: mechanosensitive ion channel family protein [Acidobacteriota bacterium]
MHILVTFHAWLRAVLVLGAALIAGLIVHAILFGILARRAGKPGRIVEASLHQHARRPARWLLPVVAMLLALPAAPLPLLWHSGLQHLFSLILIAGGAWCIMLATAVLADIVASRYRIDVADNLEARRIATQVQVMRRVIGVIVVILTLALMLLTFPGAKAIGTSMLASAGLAALVVGMAMRPTLSNLVAGIQIALTQPMRLEDAVIVENEWGWIEEITATYVAVRLWDWRRMILPLTYFIETPFQNWTRKTATLIGSVYLYLDYTAPLDALRQELERLCHATDKWYGGVCVLQVSDCKEYTIEVRALADARDAPTAWDLRCLIREGLIEFLQKNYPYALPKTRGELSGKLDGLTSATLAPGRPEPPASRVSPPPTAATQS